MRPPGGVGIWLVIVQCIMGFEHSKAKDENAFIENQNNFEFFLNKSRNNFEINRHVYKRHKPFRHPIIEEKNCNKTIMLRKRRDFQIDISTKETCTLVLQTGKSTKMRINCKKIQLSAPCPDVILQYSDGFDNNIEVCKEQNTLALPVRNNAIQLFIGLIQRNTNSNSKIICNIRVKRADGYGFKITGTQLCPYRCGMSSPEAEAENPKLTKGASIINEAHPPSNTNSSYSDSIFQTNYNNFSTTPTSVELQRIDFDSKIIGGKAAESKEWPWMVLLLVDGQICGGSLITAYHVLTAAHCVYDVERNKIRVRAGTLSSRKGQDNEQKSRVRAIHLHSRFTSGRSLTNDIAVLKLRTPFVINNHVKTICLAPPRDYTGSTGVLTGWGETKLNGLSSDDLIEVSVDIISNKQCRKDFPTKDINKNKICNFSPSRDSCFGDSGGPLVVRRGTIWYQVGIVSDGTKCGKTGLAGINTFVPSYIDWIMSKVTYDRQCK